MDIQVILNVMFTLLLMMVLGFVLRKTGMMDELTSKKISSLVVNMTCPLLVIASVSTADSGNRGEILKVLGIGTCIYLVLPLFAKLCVKLMKVPYKERATYEFMMIFANTSFMGFPVVQALFGDMAVFYTSILHLPFDILVFSYGVYILLRDQEKIKGEEALSLDYRQLLNPGLVLSVLALIIYLCCIPIPSLLSNVMYSVGNVTTPLSMMVIGASMADLKGSELIKSSKEVILLVIRLFLIPIVVYFILSSLRMSDYIVGIATVTFGMPVASMTVMMSHEYGGDVKLASKSVLLSTLGSVMTVPLLVRFLL